MGSHTFRSGENDEDKLILHYNWNMNYMLQMCDFAMVAKSFNRRIFPIVQLTSVN